MGAKGDAEPLHARDDLGRCVMFGAVENHVFQEMGQPTLVLRFHERAGRDVKTQRDTLRRLTVRINEIAEAVGQRAENSFRICSDI